MKTIEFNGASALYSINIDQRKISLRTFRTLKHPELKALLFIISQQAQFSLEKIMNFDIDFRAIAQN